MVKHRDLAGITYQHLRNIIGRLMDGVIFIDTGQRISWANESALKMHEVSSVDELGLTMASYFQRWALKYRNHHPLTRSQYPMFRLAGGEQFDEIVVEVTPRKSKDEPRIHRLRGITLNDDNDEPIVHVLLIEDLTEQHSAEERFERAFNANPAPALICRLSDLRYTRVKAGFLAMTGYRREDVLGRSVYELDILAGADGKSQAIANLHAGSTITQKESTVSLPDGSYKHVIVAGQPLDDDSEPYMLFTFIDLQPRKLAEQALRQSEERFSTAFRLTPVPMLLCDIDSLQLLEVNDSFLEMTGLQRTETDACEMVELGIWPDPQQIQSLQTSMLNHEEVSGIDIQMRNKEGETLDCILSADAVTIDGRACMLAVIQDFTERKHTEGELLTALDAVMQDTSWFSRKVMDQLARVRQPAHDASRQEMPDLTPREREVLGHICQGQSDAEISSALSLSRNTIRNHVANIYNKIGVTRRSAAVIWGRERGFLASRTSAGRGKRP